jgi:hypothetical protein
VRACRVRCALYAGRSAHVPEKFVHGFDAMLCASGMESVVMPPRSPNLNAHYERFVRSIKEAALHQMMVIGEADCSAS